LRAAIRYAADVVAHEGRCGGALRKECPCGPEGAAARRNVLS
jgi:hypothetical protein